jgi:hypothetical protein
MATYRDKESDVGGSGGGFTPTGARRIPFANVGSTALEDDAGFTWNKTSYTLFGQGGTLPKLELDTSSGTTLAFGTSNHVTISTISTGILGRFRLGFPSTAVTAASSTNLANGASVRLQGTTTINYFTKTSLVSGNLYYVFVENGLTINHNAGAPGATEAPILMRSGANSAVPAGQVVCFWYDLVNNKFVEVTGFIPENLVEVADTDRVVTPSDLSTVHTAPLTANRNVTLPNAATVPNGWKHRVFSPSAMGGFSVVVAGDINILSAATFSISTADTGVEFVKCSTNWRVI